MKGILYIVFAVACSMFTQSAHAQKKLETAVLSLQYPANWVVDMNRLEINGTVRLSPKDNPSGKLGTEVVIDFMPLGLPAGETVSASESKVADVSGMKRGISTTQIGGKPAAKTTIQLGDLYTVSSEVLYKDKLCRITCFTNSDKRETLQKDFDLIVESIKFK